MIPYNRQKIFSSDITKVIKVLNSSYLTQGPYVEKFEKKLCDYTRANYCISVNSATSALHLACLSLGLNQNDHVWTVSNSFVATANCAKLCGAIVSFLDIDIETYLIDIEKLKVNLILAKKKKKLPKVLITVHLSGQPTIQERIKTLSDEYNFKIIEDASHSLGSKRNNEPVGSCKFSDAVIFSFHPVKMITTGEGGAILTNNKKIYKKGKGLRTHGITKEKKEFITKNPSPWHYEQQDLGYNYRMNDIAAALGISQLSKLNKFVKKRNEIADFYKKNLIRYPIFLPKIITGNLSSFHLFIIRLNLQKLKISHKNFFIKMRDKGINVNLHYQPIHLQPYYKNNCVKLDNLNNTITYANSAISIPIYVDLKLKDQKYIIKVIKELCNKYKNGT